MTREVSFKISEDGAPDLTSRIQFPVRIFVVDVRSSFALTDGGAVLRIWTVPSMPAFMLDGFIFWLESVVLIWPFSIVFARFQ